MQTTGLVGAFSGLASRISKPKIDPLAWIIRFVAIAGVILIAKKAGYDFTWANSTVVLALGLAALCGEFYFSGEVVRSWYERSIVSVFAFTLLWTCAFGYSVNQWLGAASDGQFEKAGFQKAAFIKTQDAENTEAELQADVRRIQERLKLTPSRTPEGARKDQDNAKAHRFWKRTEGCTQTFGNDTRKFCSAYASAVSDESLGTEMLKLREELKVKQADLAKVRAERKDAPVVVSAERTDLRIYTQYAGMSQQQAMDVQAFGTIAFISLVLSGLGMLREAKHHRGRPRKAWGFITAIRRAIWGGPADPHPLTETPAHTERQPVSVRGDSFMDRYRQKCRLHGVAALPAAT